MNLFKVVFLCVFAVSAVTLAVNAEPKDDAKAGDSEDVHGVCVSKEECVSASEEEAAGKKYAEEGQGDTGGDEDGKSDPEETSQDTADKDDAAGGEEGDGGKAGGGEEEGEQPKKGEEERHLVKIEVLGKGKFCDKVKATNDDSVTVHLRGNKVSDGSEFITTYNEDGSEGLSIVFRMGVGDSIKGLELGVIGMCIDELRRLTVPASLVRNGRDEFKGDKIPRGEDLVFEVRLLGTAPNYFKGMPNRFRMMDTNEDGLIQRDEIYDAIVDDGKTFPRGAPVVDELADEQLQNMDKNKDGVVQWEEFGWPKWDEL